VKQRERSNRYIDIVIRVPVEIAPALRSAVEEVSTIVGTRLESPQGFAREQALTDAAEALLIVRKAVYSKIPKEDTHYGRQQS